MQTPSMEGKPGRWSKSENIIEKLNVKVISNLLIKRLFISKFLDDMHDVLYYYDVKVKSITVLCD